MTTGENSGTWGTKTNTNLGTLLEQAIVGHETVSISDNPATPTTLTIADGVSSQARNYVLELTGNLTANRDLIVPAIEKPYTIYNNTTGSPSGFSVTVKVSGQTGVTVANGKKAIVYNNGVDVIEVANAPVTEAGTQTITNKSISASTINNSVIGGTTPAAGTFSAATVYSATSAAATIQGDAATNVVAQRSSADAVQANLIVRKTRGTVASPAAVASSDVAGNLSYQVFGGTNNRSIADIVGVVKTYTSDTNISGYLAFLTNGGSTSSTERMRITESGNVVIGNGETSATPSNGVLEATDGSGTNIAGASLTIQGGRGTGTGAGGAVILSTAAAGTSGSSLNSATERFRVGPAGQLGIGGANYGTAGQVFASGGSGAAPSWTSLSNETGNLIRAPQIITSTATTSYTTPANCTSIYVELVGAGGGGGGADVSSSTNRAAGGGGGSGAYAAKFFSGISASSVATTGASGTGSTATITFSALAAAPSVGTTVTISGVTPTGYNGTYTVTASSTTSVSYANATTGSQTVAGTITVGSTYTVAVGTGGTAGSNSGGTGGTGGSTTITVGATTVTAAGGLGGVGRSSSSSRGYASGGIGGTATNGDINISGNIGSPGLVAEPENLVGGNGAASFFGGAGRGQLDGDDGSDTASTAGTSGGGGGGAAAKNTSGQIAAVGGAGLIRIWEYT